MAVDLLSGKNANRVSKAQSQFSVESFLTTVPLSFASLRLTVGLLVIAVLVTFIGTLEQSRADINTVKSKYFLENRIFVQVPLQVFFVPAWFPNHQNVPGSIWVPSGMTILWLMIINMSAAHVLRFRLQAKGTRLAIGLMISALAGLFTWLVIFNAQNPGGLQGEPPISWEQMWIALQIAVLGIACGAAFGYFTMDGEKKYERLFMAFTAILAGSALLVTLILPNKGFIGDAAMRIVWQLTQATAAASISLVACMILFRRKGAIVLLHLGVLGLMANELYVNFTNIEQRMTLYEGQTTSQVVDIRSIELAVVDYSDPEYDQITVVPLSQLRTKQRISSEHLPFDLRVIAFFDNSDFESVDSTTRNLATQGAGLKVAVKETPPVSGVESRHRNFSSAYLELFEKGSDQSLGVFLVSQYFDLPEFNRLFRIPGKDRVAADGKVYALDLRFKTEYKPYAVTLVDTTAEYYLGTQTPKHFSSDIVFHDPGEGMRFDKRIWMNNPMRYGGETFYQAHYEKEKSGREVSVLQIVTNRGWMIPYVCCMFTVVGLLIQFGSSLLGFLEKRSKALVKTAALPAHELLSMKNTEAPVRWTASRDRWLWQWLPAIVLTGVFALFLLGRAMTAHNGKIVKNAMRLDLLGQIPVTKNGRVQPLDSVARHAVLQMSKRESVNDQMEKNQPAIRWLADSMFGVEGSDQYRLFRVEDAEAVAALSLPFPMPTKERHEKSNLRYTLKEILDARKIMREHLTGDPEKWTPLQKKFAKLASLSNQAMSLELTLGYPDAPKMGFLQRLEMADVHARDDSIPLAVPTDNPQRPWISFVELENKNWLKEVSQEYDVRTTGELAEAVVKTEFLPFQREELIKARVIEKIVNSPELVAMLTKDMGKMSKVELTRLLESRWNQIPVERTEALRQTEGPFVDEVLKEQVPRLIRLLEEQIAKVNGGSGTLESANSPRAGNLSLLRAAYRNQDAETFNRVLSEYLTDVAINPPAEMKPFSVATESWYNRFAPFYWATVIYVAVMVVAMFSWIGFSRPLNRAAGWLLWLGIVVHLVGLVTRVMISGRPPVTNLYSSFLFVAAVFAVGMWIMERLTRMQVGNFLGGLGGFLALLAAWNMTITDGDTFSVLVAVLDTQFWLATHVVTITIGYGATMIAGFLGMAFIARALIPRSFDQNARREMGKMIYGATCFGLITSFFGTVLGGLWGDDSWGRFWGWDPKENGALMIVLWNAVIVHARWGGIVKERGMAVLAILGNIITLWSWKGVNALGVGLHAYAGTEDKALIYMIVFGFVSLIIAGIGLFPLNRGRDQAAIVK
jgi:ABC-type transport system involved in cytochrome c biogenesis permease subunit